MQTYNFEFSLSGADVARNDGVIRGVSIITSGVAAKGHDLEVDHTTLLQMKACADKKKKVPVKWNHKTGADAVNGNLRNFRIEGNKLKADWHLLKSHERYAHALELAEEMPECVGLSASFMGGDELKDGTKVITPKEGDDMKSKYYFVKGEKVPVMPGEKIFARCADLVSVDLVATPAANPDGLFEARVDSNGNDMADTTTQTGAGGKKEFSLDDVMAGITNLGTQFNQLAERQANIERFFDELADEDPDDEGEGAAGVQGEDDGDDGDDGEDGEGKGEGGTAELSATEAVRYLEARLDGIDRARAKAEGDHAFAVIEDRITKLVELNQQLVAENSAMAQAITEFSAHTGATVEFSAGADGGYEPHVNVAGASKPKARTQFEAEVQKLVAGGKEEADAIMFMVREHPDTYQRHLETMGIRARTL